MGWRDALAWLLLVYFLGIATVLVLGAGVMNDHRHVRAVDRAEARRRTYLGNGVYAAFDGFGVWLTAEDGIRASDAIYLEPAMAAALARFFVEAVEAPNQLKEDQDMAKRTKATDPGHSTPDPRNDGSDARPYDTAGNIIAFEQGDLDESARRRPRR